MKIIKPYVEFFAPVKGDAVLKRLEECGRVCYKSEGRITEGSSETFLRGIIKRGHEAVLEHCSLILELDLATYHETTDLLCALAANCNYVPYLRYTNGPTCRSIVSGNIRAWRDFCKALRAEGMHLPSYFGLFFEKYPVLFPELEGEVFGTAPRGRKAKLLSAADLLTTSEKMTHLDFTVKFVCDRGVSHEIVRHRMASYCQESTRYCNYSNDQFDGHITVIEPCYLEHGTEGYRLWHNACWVAENAYFAMLDWGCTPQEARAVLPNSLKTEVVMTANIREWRHFLKLRCSPAAHPQMREVALMLLDTAHERIPVLFDDIYAEYRG